MTTSTPYSTSRRAFSMTISATCTCRLVGILVVDRLDAEEGEVPLVLLRRADLAGDHGPGAQAEPADLARRDVDVVRAGEVVVIGAAQEPEAVREDFEGPLPVHQAVLL